MDGLASSKDIWTSCSARAFPRSVAPIKCSEWVRQHVRLSSESSSVEGPMEPMPFQAVWMDVLGMDGGPEKVVVAKSARAGFTAALTSAVCYLLAEVHRNLIGYQYQTHPCLLYTSPSPRD